MVVCWATMRKKINQAFSWHVIHLQWICYSHRMCRNVYLFVWMVLLMKSTRCRYSLKIFEEKWKKKSLICFAIRAFACEWILIVGAHVLACWMAWTKETCAPFSHGWHSVRCTLARTSKEFRLNLISFSLFK